MADYKLITRVKFSDNTEAESPEELQKYVDSIKDDCLDNWDVASVVLVVDGKAYRATGIGNRHAGSGTSRLINHPWHKASEERPDTKKDIKLLGWFDTGSTAYDFDIIKYRVRDGEFCDRHGHPLMTENLWWRTLEGPETATTNKTN